MAEFVTTQTELDIVVRVGGDLNLLKTFLAAGYPVLIEKGFEGPGFEGWMGHYEVVNGYDDSVSRFIVQDSYEGPDRVIPYENLEAQWHAFNYTYLVTFPVDKRSEVERILTEITQGEQADPQANFMYALQKAQAETLTLQGRDLYFAYFNLGTNLVALKDYGGAATAYDAAFANYVTIPEEARPWRMLWYQTGPYFAYYYTGRYEDVINLATTTLTAMSEPVLEETYYWRGLAYLALGDQEAAVADFKRSAQVHPGFIPAVEQLQALGINP
jgi:tetratricopeptide (TPR) repeat protein